MIVREIELDPTYVINQFDFFNDYKDTRLWCVTNFPEVLPQFDLAYDKWIKECQDKYNNRYRKKK